MSSRPQVPNPTPTPFQSVQLKLEDLQQPGLPFLNSLLTQMQQQVNELTGASGKTRLAAGVDVAGSTISNVGEPAAPADAISKAHAEANYSATALAPQLESGSRTGLKSYRALNSKAQQEQFSSFLNRVTNTAPTTNTTVVTAGAPSGGAVTITIPAGYHLFVDGSLIPFSTFSATVALPATNPISTLTRSSGVVTANGTFSGLVAGESIYELGASDSSFDGTYVLLTASPTALTWNQVGFVDATATGGVAGTGTTFYFYLRYPSQTLAMSGPFPSDTQQHRLDANADGQVLIAVAVINGSGLVTTESAAGATLPATTSGNRIVSRL